MDDVCRQHRPTLASAVLIGATILLAAQTQAQQTGDGVSPIEAYLEDHNLPWALATELRQRMREVSPADRLILANRLGKLYVQLIDQSTSAEDRTRLQELGKQLLNDVPEADSFDLRLSLAKARYMYAEDIAVYHKLDLAGNDNLNEAIAILNETIPVFKEITSKSHRRAENIERKIENVRLEDEKAAKAELAEAQRLRSTAAYYAGWASYYLGNVTHNPRTADDGLRSFGWLLGALDGKPAAIDRAPVSFFRLDHVARSAMGAGLCESLRGNTIEGLRWLDLVENASDISAEIRAQLFLHRVSILCDGGRWSDLDTVAARKRKETGAPLETALARMICVSAMRSLQSSETPKLVRPLIERIASDALADLVQQGKIGHVLDIVRTFGSAQLGDQGFIVRYVRGLVQFEAAKQRRIDAGESLEHPTEDKELRRTFGQAADALVDAMTADDADDFVALHGGAGFMAGVALFQSGELARSASHLEKTFHLYPDADTAEEALWLAIVALVLDQELSRTRHTSKIAELAAIFLARYPAGERAATLVMRDGSDALIDQERAIEVLLAIPSASTLYMSAQQQTAKLLYKQYRSARGSERDVAATRFLSVADRVLDAYRRRMGDENRELSDAAAANSVVLIRQMLDVVTGMPAPDVSRAKAALTLLESLRTRRGIDLSGAEDELELRRLQIALYEDDQPTIASIASRIDTLKPPYDKVAAGVAYEHAVKTRAKKPDDVDVHRQVVQTGVKLIETYGPAAKALTQQSVAGLYSSTAESAGRVYELAADRSMLDLAMRIDRQLIEAGHTSLDVLRRRAGLAELSNQPTLAFDAWQIVLQASVASSDLWFEARYETLRLLAMFDGERADVQFSQHEVLYPEYGPEPWGTKIRSLIPLIRDRVIYPAPGGTS